uniref:Uncharacterized protein n=1 Tax=Panagrolaimus sp. ES5 TaxID=591445 RepID=A0AC34FNY1_9BILA
MSFKDKTKCSQKGDEVGAIFHKVDGGRLGITYKMLKEKDNNLMKLGPDRIKLFVVDFATIIKKLDAAILQLFDCQFPEYLSNVKLCEAFQSRLAILNVPHCFITEEQAIVMVLLIKAQIEVMLGENIAVMYLHEQKLDIYRYKFTKKGYKKLRFESMILGMEEKDFQEVLDKAQLNQPKYILLSTSDQSNPLFISLKNSLQILGPKFGTSNRDPAMVKDALIQQIDPASGKIDTDIDKMGQKCHRNKISLSIDANNFSKFESLPIMLPQIQALPIKLTETVASKIPIIGFCDNFSVICIHKDDENGYKFVDAWNDIIKIMSMPADDIRVEDSWGFKVTKDEANPVLLQLMTYEKTLKFATPEFLMALLIKEHRKAMKNEIGEKPEEIGFCILDENYGNEEKERIKHGLEEACKLLKIRFCFV